MQIYLLVVKRVQAGENDVFNILISRYSRLVYGIGWSITGRREDADDVVQDAFISAHSRFDRLRDGRKFPAWISQIARNTAYDIVARRKRHRIDEAWLRERDRVDTPAEELDEFNRLNHMWFALTRLKADDRITLVLHYLVGLNQQKVATTLDVPLGTVKSRLHRARRKWKN